MKELKRILDSDVILTILNLLGSRYLGNANGYREDSVSPFSDFVLHQNEKADLQTGLLHAYHSRDGKNLGGAKFRAKTS